MSRAMNWVLLQLAMSYYGDSLKEFQVDDDQIFMSFEYFFNSQNFMKLITQFSIPNPSKADLAKTNQKLSKTLKKKSQMIHSYSFSKAKINLHKKIFALTTFLILKNLLSLSFKY